MREVGRARGRARKRRKNEDSQRAFRNGEVQCTRVEGKLTCFSESDMPFHLAPRSLPRSPARGKEKKEERRVVSDGTDETRRRGGRDSKAESRGES